MSIGTSELVLEGAEAEAGAVHLISQGEIAARSPRELFLRRFREDKVAVVGLAFLILLILVAICAPLVCSLVGAPGPYKADHYRY